MRLVDDERCAECRILMSEAAARDAAAAAAAASIYVCMYDVIQDKRVVSSRCKWVRDIYDHTSNHHPPSRTPCSNLFFLLSGFFMLHRQRAGEQAKKKKKNIHHHQRQKITAPPPPRGVTNQTNSRPCFRVCGALHKNILSK